MTATSGRFNDATQTAGIRLKNTFGGTEKRFILEAHGSGAGFFDSDNDGDLDLYVVNGSTFETHPSLSGPGNVLYQNNGNGTFTDATQTTGVGHSGWGAGCAVGDVDNDGDRDLYVTNYGSNVFYNNLGNGTFTENAKDLGIEGNHYSASAAFFDYDIDGDLDLYVTNYVEFDVDNMPDFETQQKRCAFFGGVTVYCGPMGMPGAPDRLYRNDGDGFTDVTETSGVSKANQYYGLGVTSGDFDGDGNPDLFVANDETPNVLFRNDGDGTFTDVAVISGVAYNEDGDEEAGMGVAAADYDNDGDTDLYVTHFFQESNTLYNNDGSGNFNDVTASSGLGAPTLNLLGWGVAFFDWDHDRDLDLFVANGHVYPQVDEVESGSTYSQRNQLFVNDRGHFVENKMAGQGMKEKKISRGAAFGDYDNDGDTDVFVVNLNDTPTLLRNDRAENSGTWLMIKAFGRQDNRDGAGTRIRVRSDGYTQWRTINGSSSYLAHNDLRAHFGLGKSLIAEEVQLTWPNGTVDTVTDIPTNKILVVQQGGAYRVLAIGENPHAVGF